jgi:tetratricopeptide (TPR) repeat protein
VSVATAPEKTIDRDQMERYRRAVEENPDSAAAHFNLGLAHTQRGRVDRAEAAYRRALELDPTLIKAWVNLGGVLLLKWDFQGCLEANRKAVELQGDLLQAHYNMGQAYLYLESPAGLVECNRRVLELDPNHAAGHYFLAVGLLATNDVAGARASLDRATALGYRPPPDFLRTLDRAEEALNQTATTAPASAQDAAASKEE